MKKISTLLFFCICLSMAFVSCSSDDGNNQINDMTGQETDDMTSDETGDMTGEDTGNQDPITITDGFIFNKEKYPTPFVTKSIFNGYYQLTFAKENFEANDYSGNLNVVGFLISSPTAEIIPGTYTFKLDSDADYDPSKHFFDALAGVDLQYTNGEPDLSSGFFDNITSGTVTIAKENTTYTITYEFVYPEGTFEGI